MKIRLSILSEGKVEYSKDQLILNYDSKKSLRMIEGILSMAGLNIEYNAHPEFKPNTLALTYVGDILKDSTLQDIQAEMKDIDTTLSLERMLIPTVIEPVKVPK